MKIFLLVVAGVVVGLLAFAVLAYLWLRRKLAGVGEALRALAGAGGVPPFRITLEPAAAAEWNDPAATDLASSHFAAAGYDAIGDFEIPEMNGMKLRAFIHPGAGNYAVLYDHEEVGLFADLVQDFDDGTSLTVSNSPETGMDRPHHAPVMRLQLDLADRASVMQLHERLETESSQRVPARARAEDFAHAFVEAYTQEMDWRIARGGVTKDEVLRTAAAGGMEPPDDASIELVRSGWRSAIDAFIEEEVRKAWLAGSPMSASEWEARRERLHVVHEHSDRKERIEALAWVMVAGSVPEEDCAAEERALEEARARLEPIFASCGIREAVAQAQTLLPEKRRYERIASVDEPWPADLYLLPEVPDLI